MAPGAGGKVPAPAAAPAAGTCQRSLCHEAACSKDGLSGALDSGLLSLQMKLVPGGGVQPSVR